MAFDVGPAHPYIVRSSLVKVPKESEFSSSPAEEKVKQDLILHKIGQRTKDRDSLIRQVATITEILHENILRKSIYLIADD